jgi:hypothetical protein
MCAEREADAHKLFASANSTLELLLKAVPSDGAERERMDREVQRLRSQLEDAAVEAKSFAAQQRQDMESLKKRSPEEVCH